MGRVGTVYLCPNESSLKSVLSSSALMQIPSIVKAQLATLIDCEGYIGIIKGSRTKSTVNPVYSLRVSVGMTRAEYLLVLKQCFGGSIRQRQGRGKNWKPQYDWYVSGKQAYQLLRVLTSCLVLKRQQAKIGQLFFVIRNMNKMKWIPGKILDEQVVSLYETFYLHCKSLNERGTRGNSS